MSKDNANSEESEEFLKRRESGRRPSLRSEAKKAQDAEDFEKVRQAVMNRLTWAEKKASLFEDDEDDSKSRKLALAAARLSKVRLDVYKIAHNFEEDTLEDDEEESDLFERLKSALEKHQSEKKTLMSIKEFLDRNLSQNAK